MALSRSRSKQERTMHSPESAGVNFKPSHLRVWTHGCFAAFHFPYLASYSFIALCLFVCLGRAQDLKFAASNFELFLNVPSFISQYLALWLHTYLQISNAIALDQITAISTLQALGIQDGTSALLAPTLRSIYNFGFPAFLRPTVHLMRPFGPDCGA